MRILYFIGNGFDINLGLKTSYSDFLKYYIKTDSKSNLISHLKDSIKDNIENWSDLELALGRHTRFLETRDELDEIYDDLEDNLADYIDQQENSYNFSQVNQDLFINNLIHPEQSLPRSDRDKILEHRKSIPDTITNIDIVTFNYTNSIEKILDKYAVTPTVTKDGTKATFNGVQHIHGYTNNRMVMGVNDTSQISNKSFHSNIDILETLVKEYCYKANKEKIDEVCKQLIKRANLICIFGSSIGDTDKQWWNFIVNQLRNRAILIIFEKGEKITGRRTHLNGRRERLIRDKFLSKTDLSDDEKKKLGNYILVEVNSKLFNIVKR